MYKNAKVLALNLVIRLTAARLKDSTTRQRTGWARYWTRFSGQRIYVLSPKPRGRGVEKLDTEELNDLYSSPNSFRVIKS
jgi:hypothetical protein